MSVDCYWRQANLYHHVWGWMCCMWVLLTYSAPKRRLSLWYWYYQVSALVSSALHDYASDILSITIIHREDLADDATFLSLLACSIPSPELGKYSSFQRTSVNLEVYKPYFGVFDITIWVIMSLCSLQCLFPLSAQLKPSELLNILLEWIDTGTFT